MEDLDRRMLAFVGAHPFVLTPQIEHFLESDHVVVAERLVALEARRLVRSERLHADEDTFVRVTGAGLRAIGSQMPAPGFDLVGYRHEVGAVWLWVAGWRGAFGEAERVLSLREMQTLDRATEEAGGGDGRFAVPVAGEAEARARLYPDVMVVFGSGRLAVHLVSWPHRRLDLDGLFAGHRARPEVADVVLVLVDDAGVGARVTAVAERHGVGEKVRVQWVAGAGTARPASGAALRSAG